MTASAVPPVNVWEDADAFHLEAELPGLTQEQVHVAVTNRNQVTIQGERLGEDDAKGRWHRRERGFGRFQRCCACRCRWTPTRSRPSSKTGCCT